MKKLLFFLLAIVLVIGGLLGTYYFLGLQKAETSINRSVIDIHDDNYERAVITLKDVIAQYRYLIVRAPSIYLLAGAYEKMGKYQASLETYRIILSDTKIPRDNTWYIKSLISISKIYRKGLDDLSNHQTKILENYIKDINESLKQKRGYKYSGFSGVTQRLTNMINYLLTLNFNLNVEDVKDEDLILEMETELGFLYLKTKNYELAKDTFSKLNTPVSKLGLGQVYFDSGEIYKGINILHSLLPYDNTGKIQSYYIEKVFDYALYQYEQKNYNVALELFNKIITITSNNRYSEISLYYLASYNYKNNKFDNALKYIEEIIKNSIPLRDEDALLLKGYIYYDKRDYLRALKVFNEFIKKFPHSEKIKTAKEWKSLAERNIKYFG